MFKKLIYPAVFLQEDDGITITFPDLKGCISCANTFEEAFDMGKEAMELYLEDYVNDMFKSAPTPSKLKDIHLENNECIALIELNVDDYLKTLDNTAVKKLLLFLPGLTKQH
ncbi:MAG: type II toxin-antitoxin system HicB family antitoxin [Erysipelotrichaceae bacterium]|nr:type II toxin-antitoxin system HicB family antitoxin [Erysipelotrichaceae bacterium]